jgi:retron-type reverse transcriptase
MLTENTLPDEQFSFQRGRSTLQAASCLKEDIVEALRHPRGKLHAIFIDYTKAFNLINRTLLIEKLEERIGKNHTTKLLRNILTKNSIQTDDTVAKSQPLQQMNGTLQRHPLSPLLFIIATADITKAIQYEKNAKFYAYADDMVLVAKSVKSLDSPVWRQGRIPPP